MTDVRTALVIGGGIAGHAAAMALQKAGIEAAVYKARAAAGADVGAFLTLASNGIDALRVLDLAEPVLEVGFPTPVITLRSATGKPLGEAPLGRPPAEGTTSHTLKRADLHRVLHEQALRRGIRVEGGKRLVDARSTEVGVRATFDDGTTAVGDVLIGCDGVHSTVRRIVDPAAPQATYVGLVGTGGYVRGVDVQSEVGRYEMIFGKRAFSAARLRPTARSGGSRTCRAATSPRATSCGPWTATRGAAGCSSSTSTTRGPPPSSSRRPRRSCR